MNKQLRNQILSHLNKNTYVQSGGESSKIILDGGFPPIDLCDDEKQEKILVREFVTQNTTISIKDIMKKRRDETQLFNISNN